MPAANESHQNLELHLMWFNVDGHLAMSKINQSEVENESKNKPTKL
jgi:hypothetical protein